MIAERTGGRRTPRMRSWASGLPAWRLSGEDIGCAETGAWRVGWLSGKAAGTAPCTPAIGQQRELIFIFVTPLLRALRAPTMENVLLFSLASL